MRSPNPSLRKRRPVPVSRLCAGIALACAGCVTSLASAQSIDDLFGAPPAAPKSAAPKQPASPTDTTTAPVAVPPPATAPDATPSVAAPPGVEPPAPLPGLAEGPATAPKTSVTGFYQNDLAYTYAGKRHWSRFNNTLDLSAQASTQTGMGWKLGGRVYYDPIYDLADHYPEAVRDDQRFEAMVREAYVDLHAGDWEFRLGRQHIVWGEMVGLFVADVVSAKDLRQWVLPEFDLIRIPQWAARAEHFAGNFHAELVWIPYMSYNDIGKPGAEFYPFSPPSVPGVQTVFNKEKKPTGLDNSAYGARLSWLQNGWDVAGFYYSANDLDAAFSRQAVPGSILYTPIHTRIRQLGATLGKDLGPFVLKAEAVYTLDKFLMTTDPLDADGLVKQEVLDYVVGLEWSLPEETRINAQFYQRWLPNHVTGLVLDRTESLVSFLFSTQALHPRLEPELLVARSLNRADWSAQFKVTWKADGNWRLAAGVDVFEGPSDSLFGFYDDRDRVYTELRYTF